MAARANSMEQEASRREIVDLRRISARDLEPVLADEIAEWRRELDWDFTPSADLVRKYAGTNSLGGAALMVDGQAAGYGYAVIEEPRGIIGDIYVRPRLRDAGAEPELFRSLLDALVSTPRITRMESQLMLLTPESAAIIAANSRPDKPVRLFERCLMSRDSHLRLPSVVASARIRFRFESWESHFMHSAGAIIASAYKGQRDSEINAQYRSPGGARRFLNNIIEFPGCGTFHPSASFVAFDAVTGEAAGMALSSFVAADTGHVCQLCVMPFFRGAGLGQELLRISSDALYRSGARRVSLTVTASNRAAISIYEKFGFKNVRAFFAYIWDASVEI
jgi:ribosomal protein S18 acetylase RimI-like enzyme